jgi:Phenylacetic acid-responsive transcriptional repressor
LAEMKMKNHGIVLQADSGGLTQDRFLISAGWDLDELGRDYERFVAGFAAIRAALGNGNEITPEHAFVVRTLLIHEYRKIHLRDPLLPHSLLPKDWIGAEAYTLCQSLYRKVFKEAEAYVSDTAVNLGGPLPSPMRETRMRFGGLGFS